MNMKHLRLFPNTQVRDSVLADIDYPVLHSTDGVGLGIRPGSIVPPTPSYPTPFYVENITQETETLIVSAWRSSDNIPYIEILVEKSTDGINWSTLIDTKTTRYVELNLNPGDKLYLRASTNAWYTFDETLGEESICQINGASKIGGNIMSLIYGGDFTGNETTFPNNTKMVLCNIFGDDNHLIDASQLILPATTLTDMCYGIMFSNCTSLTAAPTILPATTLALGCYSNMFNRCTSLTTAPELPATILDQGCYVNMFNGCTNLNYIKCLATDISASGCTTDWVDGVAASGTFVKAASMSSWGTGIAGIPSGWTVQDAA